MDYVATSGGLNVIKFHEMQRKRKNRSQLHERTILEKCTPSLPQKHFRDITAKKNSFQTEDKTKELWKNNIIVYSFPFKPFFDFQSQELLVKVLVCQLCIQDNSQFNVRM